MSTAEYPICAAARKLVREAYIDRRRHLVGPPDYSKPCPACAMELRAQVQLLCGWPGARWTDNNAIDSDVIQAFIRGWNDALHDGPRQILKVCVLMDIRKGSAAVECLRLEVIEEWVWRLNQSGIYRGEVWVLAAAEQEAVARSVVRLVRKLARVIA